MSDRVPGSAPISRVARGSIAAFLIYGAGIGLTYCSQLRHRAHPRRRYLWHVRVCLRLDGCPGILLDTWL